MGVFLPIIRLCAAKTYKGGLFVSGTEKKDFYSEPKTKTESLRPTKNSCLLVGNNSFGG